MSKVTCLFFIRFVSLRPCLIVWICVCHKKVTQLDTFLYKLYFSSLLWYSAFHILSFPKTLRLNCFYHLSRKWCWKHGFSGFKIFYILWKVLEHINPLETPYFSSWITIWLVIIVNVLNYDSYHYNDKKHFELQKTLHSFQRFWMHIGWFRNV